MIQIDFIPESEMRYPSLGDWYERDGIVYIRAAEDDGPDQAFLVALHELVEWWLCKKAGISEQSVDAWDLAFDGHGEPGDDPSAIYRQQHRQAMIVEHLVAQFAGLTGYGVIT